MPRPRPGLEILSGAPPLKRRLDDLYAEFNRAGAAVDPIEIVRRTTDPADREVVAFCAAALAFGRVASVLASVEALVGRLGPSPARFVRELDPRHAAGHLAGLGHRWTRAADLLALLMVLQHMLHEAGSIEGFFLRGHDRSAPTVEDALESFCRRAQAVDVRGAYGRRPAAPGVHYFFPRPSSGSACKRLNLFLRWMVRRDAVDPGGWTGVPPSQLIVPLDTHVIRLGRCLRLTRYVSPGWRMAEEITAALRRLDPHDPVRYDFALCHVGMTNGCGFNRPSRDACCPLRGFCRPVARRAPRSRRPSARR